MKKTTLVISIALFGALGCSSTVTLGPKANESTVVGASAGAKGAKITVPFASAEVTPTESSSSASEKKK
tara:strand:+ start:287 stop:493 length:207 start_codon:yes stop_codon:yes gene_type:complete